MYGDQNERSKKWNFYDTTIVHKGGRRKAGRKYKDQWRNQTKYCSDNENNDNSVAVNLADYEKRNILVWVNHIVRIIDTT